MTTRNATRETSHDAELERLTRKTFRWQTRRNARLPAGYCQIEMDRANIISILFAGGTLSGKSMGEHVFSLNCSTPEVALHDADMIHITSCELRNVETRPSQDHHNPLAVQ
jgi:hypothetical protein